jgi:hypothetical protein
MRAAWPFALCLLGAIPFAIHAADPTPPSPDFSSLIAMAVCQYTLDTRLSAIDAIGAIGASSSQGNSAVYSLQQVLNGIPFPSPDSSFDANCCTDLRPGVTPSAQFAPENSSVPPGPAPAPALAPARAPAPAPSDQNSSRRLDSGSNHPVTRATPPWVRTPGQGTHSQIQAHPLSLRPRRRFTFSSLHRSRAVVVPVAFSKTTQTNSGQSATSCTGCQPDATRSPLPVSPEEYVQILDHAVNAFAKAGGFAVKAIPLIVSYKGLDPDLDADIDAAVAVIEQRWTSANAPGGSSVAALPQWTSTQLTLGYVNQGIGIVACAPPNFTPTALTINLGTNYVAPSTGPILEFTLGGAASGTLPRQIISLTSTSWDSTHNVLTITGSDLTTFTNNLMNSIKDQFGIRQGADAPPASFAVSAAVIDPTNAKPLTLSNTLSVSLVRVPAPPPYAVGP